MKLLHIALSTALLCVAAGAAPAGAASLKDTDAAAVAAAAAGWGLAYETDPRTGRSVLLGFVGPDGQVVPFAEGQQGYSADPRTGELTALVPGQSLPAVPAGDPGPPRYFLEK
ncbi:hypothetical protein AB0N06_23050 [Streptomyces sp. NPDC051020]|uniref:hypothetical protein n=1 Tax=Streptomyces sp. NPDC051020 TaxID=3155409 RepID=UPI0034441D7F